MKYVTLFELRNANIKNYGKIKIFHGITYKIHIIPLWINESKNILLDKYIYSHAIQK